jgi:hypothetical protein
MGIAQVYNEGITILLIENILFVRGPDKTIMLANETVFLFHTGLIDA